MDVVVFSAAAAAAAAAAAYVDYDVVAIVPLGLLSTLPPPLLIRLRKRGLHYLLY